MTQPNLLELAKKGDSQAIASLINRQLQPRGITAKVALKNACLQIMLESAEVPNQQALVALIRKGITGLGATSIEKVKIYGREIGEEFPSWSQEFELVVQSGSTLSTTNGCLNLTSEQSISIESTLLTQPEITSNNKNIYYEIEGSNGQIRLTYNRIIISRNGVTAFITQGLKGNKEIPIKRITAIQFKPADTITKGYLQFSIEGSFESTGGIFAAVTDENTVVFTWAEQPEFEEIKRYIDSVIDSEPINFQELRFSELKILKSQRIQEEKVAIQKAIESENIFWRQAIKPLIIAIIISLILVLLAPDVSGLKILAALSFVIGSSLLIFALIKSL